MTKKKTLIQIIVVWLFCMTTLLISPKAMIYVKRLKPFTCPRCQGEMRIIAFLSDYTVVDRIIQHLKLTFVAERPPPPHVAYQEILVAAEAGAKYFS